MYLASALDWGTVPAWVGSVLTGGSLLLGFSILRRDRSTAVRAQAEAVIPDLRKRSDPNTMASQLVLQVRNTSALPIRRPTLIATGRPVGECLATAEKTAAPNKPKLTNVLSSTEKIAGLSKWVVDTNDFPGDMEGNQQCEIVLDLRFPAFCYWYVLVFADAKGVNWVYEFRYEKLKRLNSLDWRKTLVTALGSKKYISRQFYAE